MQRPLVVVAAEYPRAMLVQCDASFLDGDAGLGVNCFWGRRSALVRAETNLHAEMLALRFAMELPEMRDVQRAVFMLDCRAVVDWARGVERKTSNSARRRGEGEAERGDRLAVLERKAGMRGWHIEYVQREAVAGAHLVAGEARRSVVRLGVAGES